MGVLLESMNIQAIALMIVVSVGAGFGAVPEISGSLGPARVHSSGNRITASTGTVERSWLWTGHGLATVSVVDQRTGREWVNGDPAGCDWEEGEGSELPAAELVSLTAERSDDDGFTSEHLRVRADVRYPASGRVVRHETWVYPGSEGMRTQLWMKQEDAAGGTAGGEVGGPGISVVSGRPVMVRAALDVAPVWHARSLQGQKGITLRFEGLDPSRTYHLGFSWWDYGNGGRRQRVVATSIDGEARSLLVKPQVLPGWKEDHRRAESLVVEIPRQVNLDGSTTIIVDRLMGPSAVLCEAWLYGSGRAGRLEIDAGRKRELEGMAPEGCSLLAYLDGGSEQKPAGRKSGKRTDFLPVRAPELRAIGYFNDTQNRHRPDTHLVRDEVVGPGSVDWANILCLENGRGGVALVKESHKCVNQAGVDTGGFEAGAGGVAVTGRGLPESQLAADWRWCWATWMVLYPEASDDLRELALKRFDRTRYPMVPGRDAYLKANTWGSGINQPESMARASEDEVLAEMDSVADLGLDAIQIDDGWQNGRKKDRSREEREWQPRADWYPQGWSRVVERADKLDLDLGVWFAARAPLEDLVSAYDGAGFTTFKLDFASLRDFSSVEQYLAKGRSLVAHSGHKARVNWDVTENAARFGYFWARECGSVWLANRKPMKPESVVPRPWLMLREVWELARYLNPQKFELPVSNFRMVNQKVSDAHLYSDTYAVALGLPGLPVFFQTTRLLEPGQRAEVKEVLKSYRAVRDDLFGSYVFPVGSEPDNASWAGFQWVDPDSGSGYLLVFRERLNEEAEASMPLRFLKAGTRLALDDLLGGTSGRVSLDSNAALPLVIGKPGGVFFGRYRVVDRESRADDRNSAEIPTDAQGNPGSRAAETRAHGGPLAGSNDELEPGTN